MNSEIDWLYGTQAIQSLAHLNFAGNHVTVHLAEIILYIEVQIVYHYLYTQRYFGRKSSWLIILNTYHNIRNNAIRDGRPRPPRHQVGWDIVRRECACQISWWSVEKWRRYYILKFHGNTFRWPILQKIRDLDLLHLTLTFFLDLWPWCLTLRLIYYCLDSLNKTLQKCIVLMSRDAKTALHMLERRPTYWLVFCQ